MFLFILARHHARHKQMDTNIASNKGLHIKATMDRCPSSKGLQSRMDWCVSGKIYGALHEICALMCAIMHINRLSRRTGFCVAFLHNMSMSWLLPCQKRALITPLTWPAEQYVPCQGNYNPYETNVSHVKNNISHVRKRH